MGFSLTSILSRVGSGGSSESSFSALKVLWYLVISALAAVTREGFPVLWLAHFSKLHRGSYTIYIDVDIITHWEHS